ncbi:multi-sensor hybrid histidine kinase, partial [Planoprotostelium fungivorum]
ISDMYTMIRNAGQSLLTLINDTILVGKIALVPFVETCLMSMSLLYTNQLDIGYRIHSSCPKFIYQDENRLRQILFNLFSNSIKFTLKGQVVLIVNTCTMPNGKEGMEWSFIGSGIGMEEWAVERLFGRFFQASQGHNLREGCGKQDDLHYSDEKSGVYSSIANSGSATGENTPNGTSRTRGGSKNALSFGHSHQKQQLNSSNHLKQLLSASNQRQVPISDLMKILFLALLVLSAAIQLVHAFPHKPDHAEDGTYSAPAVDDNNLNMVFLHLELTGVAAYHSNDTNRNTWTRVYEVVLDSGNGDIQRSVFWLPSLESFVAIVEHEWRKEKSYHFSKDGITWVETGRYPYDPKDIVSEEQLVEAYGQTFLARINYDKQSVETLADELTWVVKWNFTVNSTPCKPDPIRGTC